MTNLSPHTTRQQPALTPPVQVRVMPNIHRPRYHDLLNVRVETLTASLGSLTHVGLE